MNVSYFIHFTDDPTIASSASLTKPNVQRGAAMLFATAEFRKLVCTGMLPPERIGKKKTLICATAYKYMFNACRIPHHEQDSYRIYDPSRNNHCIVARKGHFFSIVLVDDDGNALPVTVLEDQLQQCIEFADRIPSSRPKLGLMTSGNRDEWAGARDQLLNAGGLAMKEALEQLESGAILLNLDDEEPISRQECGELFWTGGLKSGGNRWFDKSIQIMISNNGKAGGIAEHSMMDGMPVVVYYDYITKVTYAEAKRRSRTGSYSIPIVHDIFSEPLGLVDVSLVEAFETTGKKHFLVCGFR